jgi:DNA repair ATPase RecN
MKAISDLHKNEITNAVAGMNTASMDIDRLSDEIEEKIAELNEAIHRYNNMLKNVEETRNGIVAQMEDYSKSQPEDWPEGLDYAEWYEQWDGLDTDPLNLIDDIHVDVHSHADEIEQLRMSIE